MAKFKLTSWLRPANGNTASAEKEPQKANRRSFSAFASVPAFKHKEGNTSTPSSLNGNAKSATVTEEPTSTLTTSTRMTELANKIATETARIEKYMTERGLAMPGSVAQDTADFPKLPADVQRSRLEVVHATAELERLMKGPKETVRWMAWGFLDVMALQILSNFGIPQLIPSEGTISLAELQTKTTLDPINLARLLRYSMTTGVFCEPTPGQIGHTAASMALAKDKALVDWVGFNTEDIFPASANVLKALKQYPEATSLTRTGFNFAFDTIDKEPMFATFGKDPARARRMGGAMASLTGGEGYEVFHLVDGGYDFSEIDKRGGTLVDIGGSHGFVCVDLGKKYRNMKFVVQDLPKTIDSAPKPICEDEQVADRITLQAHDFFTEQKVKDADVYFFRWILHNYSTPYAIKLLKNLVPALKPGARILINDHCLREPGSETPWDERVMRGMDLVMLTLLNAQERDEREFRQLFAAADEGYSFVGVTRKEGCRMSVVEAVWKPDEVVKEGKTKEGAKEETKPGNDGSVRETGENEGVDVKPTEEPKGEEGVKKEEEKPAEAKSE